jgi:hypothetical protein
LHGRSPVGLLQRLAAMPAPCIFWRFLPPYIVIGSFPTNEIKLLSFVISLYASHAWRLRSLDGMGGYDDDLGGLDRRARATSV